MWYSEEKNNMNIKIRHKSKNTINELEVALNELKTSSANTDTFNAWLDTTQLEFFDSKDKEQKFPKNMETLLSEYKQDIGHRATAKDAEEILEFFIKEKQQYKLTKETEQNVLITSGPKYTKTALSYIRKKVELRDELFKINSFDVNLFQNFKMCGEQLVLVERS